MHQVTTCSVESWFTLSQFEIHLLDTNTTLFLEQYYTELYIMVVMYSLPLYRINKPLITQFVAFT